MVLEKLVQYFLCLHQILHGNIHSDQSTIPCHYTDYFVQWFKVSCVYWMSTGMKACSLLSLSPSLSLVCHLLKLSPHIPHSIVILFLPDSSSPPPTRIFSLVTFPSCQLPSPSTFSPLPLSLLTLSPISPMTLSTPYSFSTAIHFIIFLRILCYWLVLLFLLFFYLHHLLWCLPLLFCFFSLFHTPEHL